jgi:dTDP-4-amino-4,6-dideoxygalactose transaminase
MGRQFGGKVDGCPVTEDVGDRLLRLPFYTDMTEADLSRAVTAIKEFKFTPSE